MSDPTAEPSSSGQSQLENDNGSGSGRRRHRLTATRSRIEAGSQPQFTQPVRQIFFMLIVLVLVGLGGWFAYRRILPVFWANPYLNGLILAVFVMGVLSCFWQVAQLINSVSWIERFAARRKAALESGVAAQADGEVSPRLLAPLAALLGARGPVGGVISPTSARSILDSVATRIDEARDISRYLTNLLIFLGLLGTFYGLATTIPAVVETIRALEPQEGESGVQVFDKLMGGLESQLGGMATAFSSSLLGLGGSLVVGLLDLFATHGQNRFYRELEEWLSSFTRLGFAGGSDGESIDQATVAGFLDQIALQMQGLHEFYAERDDIREQEAIEADERALLMARNVERLGEHMLRDTEATVAHSAGLSRALDRIAGAQAEDATDRAAAAAQTAHLVRLLERIAEGQEALLAQGKTEPAPELVAVAAHLRSIDDRLGRVIGELQGTRHNIAAELRTDIGELTKALKSLDPDDNDGGQGWR